MVVQLAEDALFAERGLELAQPRLAVRRAEIEEVASMLAYCRQRRPRLAFGLVGMGEAEQPAQVRIALEIARDEDQLVAVHLEGAADDGFDAELAAGLEVTNHAVDAAAVGEGEGGHLELGGAHGKLGRMRAAVQEREVGMAVQLDIRRRHHATRESGRGANSARLTPDVRIGDLRSASLTPEVRIGDLVIHSLEEPFVGREVVIELAQ